MSRRILKSILLSPIILFFILLSFKSNAATSVESLVDKFVSLTEIQQKSYAEKIEGSITVYGSGEIEDVAYPSWLDIYKEAKGYYRVVIKPQETSNGNLYDIVFLFKDLDKIKDFNKGDKIRKAGKLLKIINWGMWVSVWILVE